MIRALQSWILNNMQHKKITFSALINNLASLQHSKCENKIERLS